MENLISPPLLHKHKQDDVLLKNPRRVLPSRFVSRAASDSSDKRVREIESLYLAKDKVFTFDCRCIVGNALGIPFETVMDESESDITRAVPHQVIDLIRRDGDIELDEGAVEAFLHHHGLESRSSSFELVNQADHYFFYRKPHEHVPGIMFIEAARQTVYFQLYGFTNIKLGLVTISLNEQNAKYYSYGELMYPMEIIVDNLTEGDLLNPKKAHISTSFYQRGALIARIESHTPIIPLGRFEKARNAFLIDANEMFEPIDAAKIVTLLTLGSSENGRSEVIRLHEIGLNHSITSGYIGEEDSVDLSLIYAGKFIFHGRAIRLDAQDIPNEGKTKWRFEGLTYDDTENLKEIIKRGFIVKKPEKRERVTALSDVELAI